MVSEPDGTAHAASVFPPLDLRTDTRVPAFFGLSPSISTHFVGAAPD